MSNTNNDMALDKCNVCGWEGSDDELIESTDFFGKPESQCPQCGSSYIEPLNYNVYDDEEEEDDDDNLI